MGKEGGREGYPPSRLSLARSLDRLPAHRSALPAMRALSALPQLDRLQADWGGLKGAAANVVAWSQSVLASVVVTVAVFFFLCARSFLVLFAVRFLASDPLRWRTPRLPPAPDPRPRRRPGCKSEKGNSGPLAVPPTPAPAPPYALDHTSPLTKGGIGEGMTSYVRTGDPIAGPGGCSLDSSRSTGGTVCHRTQTGGTISYAGEGALGRAANLISYLALPHLAGVL